MSFLWPELLSLLLLVPLLAIAYILAQRRRQKYTLRYASLSLVREAMGKGPGMRRHIPAIIFLVALTAMVVALARPAATLDLPSQRGTVILTFDISGSMRADDLQPNRMEAAKEAARAFVDKQPASVRIGVVAFSTDATLVQAPTTKREDILAAIDRLRTQRSTAIGRGIQTSLDAIFEDEGGATPAPAGNPYAPLTPVAPPSPTPLASGGLYRQALVILLSDGQSNAGPPPLEVVPQAQARGVRVYTVGLGSPEGTILHVEGRSIRVRLDEDTLKLIADRTAGEYFRAGTETDLRGIYEKLGSSLVFETQKEELTAWFTAFAGVLLLAAGALSLLWFSRLP